MTPFDLESVSRSLESSLDWWGWFILVSTAIVAVGLVVEYWEPFWEFIEELRRPAAAFPWRKFMGLAGGILVTIGVFGEFWGTYKASRVETSLRANNHLIEQSLSKESSGANERAGRLDKEAATSRKDAGELLQQNLENEAKLEEERDKRTKLALSLRDRHFKDQSGAVAALAGLPPMQAVFEFLDEHEPRKTAEQINTVLISSGWSTQYRLGNELTIRDGVTISTGHFANWWKLLPSTASALERTELPQRMEHLPSTLSALLTKSGIDAVVVTDSPPVRAGLPPEALLIRIGEKPNPAVDETLRELGPQPPPTPLSGHSGKLFSVTPGSVLLMEGVRTPIQAWKPDGKNQ